MKSPGALPYRARGLQIVAALVLALGSGVGAVRAHAGEPPAPHDLAGAWNVDPSLWLSLGLVGGLYAWGVLYDWRKAGPGRGVTKRQAAAFSAPWAPPTQP